MSIDETDTPIDELLRTVFYADTDQDGYGDTSDFVLACEPSDGYVSNDLDCDDDNESLLSQENDIDCDGTLTDEDCDDNNPSLPSTDADCDGSPTDEDCDDNNEFVFPLAVEICNDIDDNCDDIIDEDATDILTLYVDEDGDGFGSDASMFISCTSTENTVDIGGDCNDFDIYSTHQTIDSD